MSNRAVILTIACMLFPIGAGAEELVRAFEHSPFDDLVVPEVEPEDREALAQALASEGLGSFESGDHQTAARQLEVSYRLFNNAEYLDTLGFALGALGHHRAAAERLERYLDEGASIDAERRERAEQALSGSRQHFAAVIVSTDPVGAQLRLGDQPLGTTPLPEPLVLDAGSYVFHAQLEGYGEAIEELDLPGGDPVDLMISLVPIEGHSPGLSIGLWSSVGLALACAAVLVPSIVLAVKRTDAINDAEYPSSEMRGSAVAWRTTSFVMAGATGAATVSTIVFGVLNSVRRGEP